MYKARYIVTLSFLLWHTAAGADPVVQLSHGGQLKGKSLTYNNTDVAIFLGIPYAEAPVGKLRFQKPEAYPSWEGERDATIQTPNCPQQDVLSPEIIFGSEDCLHLDITVPGEVNSNNKKAVMVWIHGGGYTSGAKNTYFGAPLAITGDVIVVAINYRLGLLGFLSNGAGTGNFGLWDQRAAIMWVKENIEKFGGDPELITIFGESAGAGSVSAQMMSPHNTGLFRRAIVESGSLFSSWSWHISQNNLHQYQKNIKEQYECSNDVSVYTCLADKTIAEIFSIEAPTQAPLNYFIPFPDEDFFSEDIVAEAYNLSGRFDLLQGFNGQEMQSNTAYSLPFFFAEDALNNGLSLDSIKGLLEATECAMAAPLSTKLCVEFLVDLYHLDQFTDNQQRTIAYSHVSGELNFNVDSVRMLMDHSEHSSSSQSTYAYYFTELTPAPALSFQPPDWLRVSADHFAEVAFVFGGYEAAQNDELKEAYLEDPLTDASGIILKVINATSEDLQPLSNTMMTMWTNFAKSGNPNQPVALPADVPEWPQFNTETNKFLDLNKDNISVITTPHKERLEKVQSVLFEARRLYVLVDIAPVECAITSEGSGGDSVKEENSATTLVLSHFLFLLPMCLVSKHLLFF